MGLMWEVYRACVSLDKLRRAEDQEKGCQIELLLHLSSLFLSSALASRHAQQCAINNVMLASGMEKQSNL